MSDALSKVKAGLPVGRSPARLGDSATDDLLFEFRDFTLAPGSRTLRFKGEAVDLGSRAFDLLVALLRGRGTVMSKRRIMDEVWPSTIVDESNLRFQMARLRRVLGPDRDVIKTIQGRGYLLIAEDIRVSGHEDTPPPPTPAERTTVRRVGPAVVSLVEDDEPTREAIEGLLRSCGFRVEAYSSSQAFLEVGRAAEAECLILDVWLPGPSGLELQAELKTQRIDIPIIFISGHADIHMSVRAMKAGAVEFLTKPVRHEDLLEAVSSAVEARRERA